MIDDNLVVYNPLKYARAMHLKYIEEYAYSPNKNFYAWYESWSIWYGTKWNSFW